MEVVSVMFKKLPGLVLVSASFILVGCSGPAATDKQKGDEVQELDLDFKGKTSFDPNAESKDKKETSGADK